MKDQETVEKFIERRAQGASFVRIAAELGVAKSTLTEWSRKFRFEIHNRRALVLDDLQDRILGTVQSRVSGLAEKLGRVEQELNGTRSRPSSRLWPSKTGRAGLCLDPLDRSFRAQTGTAPTLPQMVP